MESAMVEVTNETDIDTIQMEQYAAEFNVAMAAFNAFNKYSLIAEYAQCDVDEFVQESLDDKINKVEDWKNSGGKAKKALGSAVSALLKMIRAVANFFKRLFGKETNPFARIAKALRKRKALKSGHGKSIGTKDVGTDVNRRIADNEEKARLKGELDATKSKLAETSKELAEAKEGLKQLGLMAANWRAQYEGALKALDEANTALEALRKAKSESDANLRKSEELLGHACTILAKVSNPNIYKKKYAGKVSKESSDFLYGPEIDYDGAHAAARKKASETMDDLIADFDELAKKSQEIPEKVEKLQATMLDVKDSGFMPPAVVNNLEKLVSNANELGHKTVKTVAEIQKDPILAQFAI